MRKRTLCHLKWAFFVVLCFSTQVCAQTKSNLARITTHTIGETVSEFWRIEEPPEQDLGNCRAEAVKGETTVRGARNDCWKYYDDCDCGPVDRTFLILEQDFTGRDVAEFSDGHLVSLTLRFDLSPQGIIEDDIVQEMKRRFGKPTASEVLDSRSKTHALDWDKENTFATVCLSKRYAIVSIRSAAENRRIVGR
jgi:hypothetical protein